MTIGTKLKKLLEERGMNQSEFARAVGIDVSTINKYVNDKVVPKESTLKRMADVLGEELVSTSDPSIVLRNKISNILLKRNLTKTEFARMTGISLISINRYLEENSKEQPRLSTVRKIEKTFKIDLKQCYPKHKKKVLQNSDGTTLGEEIRNKIAEKNTNAVELANTLGVQKANVYRYIKNAVPSKKILKKIGETLDIPIKKFKIVEIIEEKPIFTKRLELYLVDRNMKLIDLAKLSGINKNELSKYLNARNTPNINNIVKIADVLQVSISDLFGGRPYSARRKKKYNLHEIKSEEESEKVFLMNCKKMMQIRNITSYELCNLVKLTPNTVYKLLRDGKYKRVETVMAIAEALNISVDELIGHQVKNSNKTGGKQ